MKKFLAGAVVRTVMLGVSMGISCVASNLPDSFHEIEDSPHEIVYDVVNEIPASGYETIAFKLMGDCPVSEDKTVEMVETLETIIASAKD